ncbi:hypothetical protein [uncultured Sneathiella sp.]|jgi:hypothetical protein|uniref:hypothetical protein n=1 Tax=uncultured Sneathiella sp. TaxID=879315 RepID=UPI0030D7C9AB|tara:strand:- start:2569 stop:3063 length:495 start_codon:yes stop_codon:yes gene_type:complete
MLKSVAVFAALLFIVAGCAKGPEITTLPKDGKKSAPVSAVSGSAPASIPSQKKPDPPVIAAKPPAVLEPTIVVGKTTSEIGSAFGDPNMRRKDSPAEVWQYLAPDCALHLFFYPASSGGEMIVRHIAINGRSVETYSELDRKKCFNDYLRAVGAENAFAAPGAS